MARADARWWLAALLTMVMTATTTRPAHGDPGDGAAGQRLLDEGLRRQDAGDLQGALDLFRRAFDASRAPEVLFLVCQVELKLQMRIEARRDLDKLLALPSLDEQVRSKASRALQYLETLLARLDVAGAPHGASVQVDGETRQGPVWLYPGPHVVTVDAPGYEPFLWKGQLGAGERKDLPVRLRALPPPLPPLRLRDVKWGVAVMGVGVSGLMAGTVAFAAAKVRTDQSRPLCPGKCTPAGYDLFYEAKHYAQVSDVALASGAALTAAGVGLGVWMWLHSPAVGSRRAARLPVLLSVAGRQGGGSLVLEGRW